MLEHLPALLPDVPRTITRLLRHVVLVPVLMSEIGNGLRMRRTECGEQAVRIDSIRNRDWRN